ncbi:MAG: hypothetical protein ABI652_02930 [Acidobacteriota bacterium]
MSVVRTYRAGASIEDFCRACKTDRIHTVVAADADGVPLRVTCGFCRSEHNYRGGPRVDTGTAGNAASAGGRVSRDPGQPSVPTAAAIRESRRAPASREGFPFVADRERVGPVVTVPQDASVDLEMLLRRVIREEGGLTSAVPADKWRDGTLVLRPGAAGLQEKTWPIETFFHKVVMVRNRLRTLEQQVNASDLPDDVKVKLQGYVSGCYGSLTSFNILFADEDDQFKGSEK